MSKRSPRWMKIYPQILGIKADFGMVQKQPIHVYKFADALSFRGPPRNLLIG